MRRNPSGHRASSANATSGPIAAPSVSSPRCSPNARPRHAGATESASRASRGGLRSPLPTRSAKRRPSTLAHEPASANSVFATPESP